MSDAKKSTTSFCDATSSSRSSRRIDSWNVEKCTHHPYPMALSRVGSSQVHVDGGGRKGKSGCKAQFYSVTSTRTVAPAVATSECGKSGCRQRSLQVVSSRISTMKWCQSAETGHGLLFFSSSFLLSVSSQLSSNARIYTEKGTITEKCRC